MVDWNHSWLHPFQNAFKIICSETLLFRYMIMFLLAVSIYVLMRIIYAAAMVHRSVSHLWEERGTWSLCIGYIIFACVNGHGSIVNWFLSHPRCQPLSRLSFNIYLVHQTAMDVMYANRKVAWNFSLFSLVSVNSTLRLN